MTQVIATRRPLPEITTPVSAKGWDWELVNSGLRKRNIITAVKLLFKRWKTVTAPKGTPCNTLNMHDEPLYRFKELNGSTYQLEMEPGIGFCH